MISPYIMTGRLIESANGKFMIVEGCEADKPVYYLINIREGELVTSSDNINSFRKRIGVIKSITKI